MFGNGTIGGCVVFVYGMGHNFRVAIEMGLPEGDEGSLFAAATQSRGVRVLSNASKCGW